MSDAFTPTVYDLAVDYARFGLTKSQAQTIIAKRFENRFDPTSGVTGYARIPVVHIQDGTSVGSLEDWSSPARQASSTVMIQRDGSILRIIPENHGPWTNGDVQQPLAAGREVMAWGGNPNIWSLTAECEGAPDVPLTDIQLAALLWQLRQWWKQPHVEQRFVGHYVFNQVTRPDCPSPVIMAQVTAALAATGGSNVGTGKYPKGMDKVIAAALFGGVSGFKFDENGPLSNLWLATGAKTGQFPAMVKYLHYTDSPEVTREYWSFSNGWLAWRPNSKTAVTWLTGGAA